MSAVQLSFTQKPANGPAMFKALVLPRKGFNAKIGLPEISATWTAAKADSMALKEYLTTLSVSSSDYLPVLYPHVMAGSMHMNMLSHKDFPIRLLGAVHLKNRIIQRKAIHVDQIMDLHSEIGAYRLVEKGVEFDFTTTAMVQGETYWEEISTYFMAGRFGGKENPSDEKSFELNKLEETEDKASWHVPADRGRRYAKITGDYNPIHMSSLAAKLFGFKRDIAHGFGVVAQGIEQSDTIAHNAEEIQLDVIFKGPVFLDSQVYLKQGVGEHQKSFDIYCGDNPKPSMCVAIKNL